MKYYETYPQIPEHMRQSLWRYANDHCPVGSFLTAVLEHDLFEAASRADSTNVHLLKDYVQLIYNELPMGCHGSPEKVKLWLDKREEEPAGV